MIDALVYAPSYKRPPTTSPAVNTTTVRHYHSQRAHLHKQDSLMPTLNAHPSRLSVMLLKLVQSRHIPSVTFTSTSSSSSSPILAYPLLPSSERKRKRRNSNPPPLSCVHRPQKPCAALLATAPFPFGGQQPFLGQSTHPSSPKGAGETSHFARPATCDLRVSLSLFNSPQPHSFR
jgi:hypothetical protein